MSIESPAAPADTCRSCGATLTGRYCARCGQVAWTQRHSIGTLARDAASRAFGIEQGFLHTVIRLSAAPGTVIRDYLSGRTRPYTHPLAYLVIAFGASALIGELVTDGPTLMSEGNAAFTGLVVPFVAAVSRLLDRHRLNYGEHLVMAMYLLGHAALSSPCPSS